MVKVMTQLSVHTENRPAALADLAETLVDADVNLVAIFAPDSAGEFGTVRLLPDRVAEAQAALARAGYTHTPVDVLVVELPHRPGALADLARLLARHHIFIRYAYSSILPGAAAGLCILRVDDMQQAKAILEERLARA